MQFYYLPISSYSQKTLNALYEKGLDFKATILAPSDAGAWADYKKNVNPFGKLPALVLEDGTKLIESTCIIEHLEHAFPTKGTRLLPEDPAACREARFLDRVFDLYVNNQMSTIFFDSRKPEGERNPAAAAAARQTLDTAYAFLEERLAKRTWAVGDQFSIADCAAAAPLAYSRVIHPFEAHRNLSAYFGRLAERPAWKRVNEEAQPFLAKLMGR